MLLEDEARGIRRIPSADLLDERQHLDREIVAAEVDGDYGDSVAGMYQHRLRLIDQELDRRRRLEHHGAPKVPNGGRIPAEIITEIKNAVDLVNLVGEHLEIVWYRAGRAYFRCTLHGDHYDRHPSLTVREDRQDWRCWVCVDRGDCFDLLIKYAGMEWVQAVKYLADRHRIDLNPVRKRVRLAAGVLT